jgi:hypothetical protein
MSTIAVDADIDVKVYAAVLCLLHVVSSRGR